MAKHIDLGLLPPDDPIYTSGLVAGGTPLHTAKPNSVPHDTAVEAYLEVSIESKDNEDD